MKAILALENGICYEGDAAGAPGETGGEVVFNTSMTGYQEVLTDPSYAGQIVTMTAPEMGNYGVSADDTESRGTQVAGFIVREASPIASNWRSDSTLRDYLIKNHIVAISNIDTRALVRVLRSSGVMRGIIATGDVDPRQLVDRAQALPSMEGSDLVLGVTRERRRRRPIERDHERPRARGLGHPGVRDLSRPPGPVARDGRRYLQAEARPSGRKPSGAGSRDRQGRDHVAEPRVRRGPEVAAVGRASDPQKPLRRHGRRAAARDQAGLLRAVPPRGFARAARRGLPVQAIRRSDGEESVAQTLRSAVSR